MCASQLIRAVRLTDVGAGRMLDWIKRIRDWNRRNRQWDAEHAEAWAGYGDTNAAGLTAFQVRCETALSEHLGRRGVGLTERCLEGAPEAGAWTDIRAQLAESAWWVVICRDGAEILREVTDGDEPQRQRGPRRGGFILEHSLEHWDALTPNDLIAVYLRFVDAVLDGIGVERAANAENGAGNGRGEKDGRSPRR
jgi:hypothetical protein